MTESRIAVNSDAIIKLQGLRDDSGAFLNDATCTVQDIADQAGNTVGGYAPPQAMTYQTDSNGDYHAAIPASAALVVNRWYRVTVRAVRGGFTREWQEDLIITRGGA
jgi:hypothetical protein